MIEQIRRVIVTLSSVEMLHRQTVLREEIARAQLEESLARARRGSAEIELDVITKLLKDREKQPARP